MIMRFYRNKALGDLLDHPKANEVKSNGINNIRLVLLKKLESLENITDKYGFTLTFNMRKFRNDDSKYMHRLASQRIEKSPVWRDVKYIMIPEFDKNGNLHYHGVIWDVYQIKCVRCIKWWRRNFGFAKPELELKYFNCGSGQICKRREIKSWCWKHYITKDFGKTGLWSLYNESCW